MEAGVQSRSVGFKLVHQVNQEPLAVTHHSVTIQGEGGLVDQLPDVLVVASDELPDVHTRTSLIVNVQPQRVYAVPGGHKRKPQSAMARRFK